MDLMIKKTSRKWLVINILCGLVLIGLVIMGPFEFLRKRQFFLIAVTLASLALIMFHYEITKNAKLAWVEPKLITRTRFKKEILSAFQQTSWSKILILMILIIIPLQLMLPRWYYLPIILSIGIVNIGFLLLILLYMQRETVIMDEVGIRVDSRLRKCLYTKMTSIELVPNLLGGYSLSWNYEGKDIIRGINQEIKIAQIKELIENNSNMKVKIGQLNRDTSYLFHSTGKINNGT